VAGIDEKWDIAEPAGRVDGLFGRKTMDSSDSYWMFSEAAIWIRTRDLSQVSGIGDPLTALAIVAESKQALEELPKLCRNGRVRALGRRCTYHDSMVKRSEPIGKVLLWKSRGEGAPSDVVEIIPTYEWPDLEWVTTDGKVKGDLRSRSLRRTAWAQVQFLQTDIMNAWPTDASSDAQFDLPPAPNASNSVPFRPAPDKTIRMAIQGVYDAKKARDEKSPNIKELPPLVLRELQQKGFTASKRHIQELADEPDLKKLRRPPGATVKSERHARQK
jgi:hypothetical protein